MLYLLLLGLARKDRLEEERPSNGKEDNHFQENQPPQSPPPCHVSESLYIKVPNGNHFAFHSFKFVTIANILGFFIKANKLSNFF